MSSLQIVLLLFIGLQSTAAMIIGSDLHGLHKVMEEFNITGDSCQDCTQIFKLLVDLLSQPDTEIQQENCSASGLCLSEPDSQQDRELIKASILEGMKAAMEVQQMQQPSSGQCLFLMEVVISMLPKDRTEASIISALDEACGILPFTECKALIDTSGKIINEALLDYATPQHICSLVKLDHGQGGLSTVGTDV